MYESLDMGC